MDSRNDVKQFMIAAEQPVRDTVSAQNFGKDSSLYMALVEEEYLELLEAFTRRDLVEIADACADLKWVIEGLEHTLGIPAQAVWDEVSRSNFSKTVAGKLVKHPVTGKVQKPDTYSPPSLGPILAL